MSWLRSLSKLAAELRRVVGGGELRPGRFNTLRQEITMIAVRAPLLLALLSTLACSNKTTAGTGRTEHERDSVIAQSKAPGAGAVKKALDVADSSRNQVAAQDSAAMAP